MSTKDLFKNYINGKWVESRSGKTFENRNPADTSELIGVFPRSGAEDVAAAADAARRAYDPWRKIPAPRRGEIIWRAARLLVEHKEELAKLMTREMGKILTETRGDVQEGIDTAFYMAGEGRRLFGQTTPSELPRKFCMSVRMPVGVVGVISPWNFPLAIPSWKIFPALICGNTIVFKPAPDTPACAGRLVEILEEAGIPPGVVNLVHGYGSEAGKALVEHPGVDLISFTGSTATGRWIAETCGRNLKRLSLEMGGKNAQLVMEDADVDLALEGALWGAFGTSGQRCTATSRLIVQEAVLKEFTEKLAQQAQKIRMGDGLKAATQMGPLINQAALEKVEKYVELGKKEDRARLVCGGHRYHEGEGAQGFFYAPTIFSQGKPEMKIAQEEIFGPVVLIMPVKSLEEAVRVHNSSRYGLSSSIYTRDLQKAFTAIQELEAGITYINSPTIGAETHLPFGGVKDTGNGHREAGSQVLDIFSEWKAVYIDYSQKLQKAQIDTARD
jgi:aldehyde dehydrogenase (NAD+)